VTGENGVTITIREIYESVNLLTKEVNGLGNRFDGLEIEIKKQNEQSNEAKVRSNQAIEVANEANVIAKEAHKDSEKTLLKVTALEQKKYEDEIAEYEKAKDQRNKFYISIASSLIPWIVIIGLGIIYIAKEGGV
jgi:hypothetical protein